MKNMLHKNKIGLIVVGSILLTVLAVTMLHKQDTQRVKDAGVAYAKRDCLKREIAEEVCNNLDFYVSPPDSFGRDVWLIHVYHADDYHKFDSSMHATVYIWGTIKISEYKLSESE